MSSQVAHRHQPAVRYSIRTRLLVVLLSLTTISVLAVGYVGFRSVQSVGEGARRVSTEALRAQAEEYLRQTTLGDAQRIDLMLEQVRQNADTIASYAVNVFERPSLFTPGGYWRPQDHMFIGPDGQYMNDEADVSSAFVPNTTRVDDRLLTELELVSYLDPLFAQNLKGNSNTAAIYMGTERDIVRYYPNINLGAVVPPDFRVTQRPWYLSANPQNNPARKAVWSQVYLDATGKGLMVTIAAPVYVAERLVGCIGVDFTLKDISASVQAARLLGSGYSFLVDQQGRALVLPAQGYQDILERGAKPDEFGTDLTGAVAEFAPVLTQMTRGATGFTSLRVGGRELLVAYAPVQSTGWSLGNVVEAETVLQAVSVFQKELGASTRSLLIERLVPIGGSILVIMAILGLVLAGRLAEPVRKMAVAAQELGGGHWDAPLPPTGQDEIGVLAQAFSTMRVQLRDLVLEQERRVAERTLELEHRATQVATGAEISYAASQVLDPDELLARVAGLIRDRFDLYYVGIFMVDENGQHAVLRAGTGEPGRIMVEGEHKLEVGGNSMVGWACAHGRARIALDVGQEAVRFANPLLPETRSEMALPLRSRQRVIGALDIQSKRAQAFDEKDITALQGMADQIAVALENARLYHQAQASLQEVERVNRLLTGGRWEAYLRTRPSNFAEFHQVGFSPFTPEEAKHLAHSTGPDADKNTIRVPLEAHSQVIGALIVESPAEGGQTDPATVDRKLLEAVAAQVAQVLENARLFEETQRLAAREQAINTITARIRGMPTVNSILQRMVEELGLAFGASRASARVELPERAGKA
jgi:GAF domain-containing protein/HAMP domain-containing protein